MRKSSSVQLFPMEFNPKEFNVGHSKIDQLPLRRHSASHLPIAQLSNYQQEIQRLKKQNAAISRENQQLRRELECLKVTSTTTTVYRTEEKVKQYKDRIRDKLSSRVKQSRNTECQTGLLSSKEVSMEPSSLTISDYYDQYKLSQRVPALSDLQDIADRFFKDYCENYAKLKCLFDCLQCSKQQDSYKRLYDLIDLYKVPLLYQKSPQSLLREISKSKQRVNTKGREEISRSKKQKQEICWQILSPKETVMRTEALLAKVCKSDQMLKALKSNENVKIFIQKIRERV